MGFQSYCVLVLALSVFSDTNRATKHNNQNKDFSYGSWTPLRAKEKDHMVGKIEHKDTNSQSPRQSRKVDKSPGKNNPGEVLRMAATWANKNQKKLTPAEDRVYAPPPPPPAYGAPPPPHPPAYGAPPPPPAPENCYLETPCTRSCGDGFKLLLPNPDGQACYGAALQVFPCNLANCPVDCVWGPWAPWSPCAPAGATHHPHSVKRQRRAASADGDGDGVGAHGHHAPNTFFGGHHAVHDPHDHHPPPLAPSAGPFCGQGRSRAIDRPAGYGGILCIGEPVEQRFCMSLQCLGPQGPIGPAGAPGIPGTNGHPGVDGRPGDRGPNGVDGRQGPPGTPGRDGAEGLPGPQGPPGVEGKAGEVGPPGAMGPPGAQGLTGEAGPRGQFGEKGPPGPPGPIGITGPAGSDGNPGVGGPAGPPGLDGQPGIPGPQGHVGVPGEQGLTGAPGPRGLQGPKGAPIHHPPPPPPVIAPLPSYHGHPPPPPPAQFQNSPQFSVPQSGFFPNKKREATPSSHHSTSQQRQFSTKNQRVVKGNKRDQRPSSQQNKFGSNNQRNQRNNGQYKGGQKKGNKKKWAKKVNKGQENQRGKGWDKVRSGQRDNQDEEWDPPQKKRFKHGSNTNFGPSFGYDSGSSFFEMSHDTDIGNEDYTDSEEGSQNISFEITTKVSPPKQNKQNEQNRLHKRNDWKPIVDNPGSN